MNASTLQPETVSETQVARTATAVLFAVAGAHLLNDLIQSLVVASYPLFKESFHLSFAQIGLITLVYQCMASLLQPIIGLVADRRPMPYALCVGMSSTLIGLLILAVAGSLSVLLVGAALVGIGSAVFHPEASRVARRASGGRFGMAQSVFQVGGNAGSAIGPLAAVVVLTRGQSTLAWFSLAALLAIVVLIGVGRWSSRTPQPAAIPKSRHGSGLALSRGRIAVAMAVLGLLVFSKYVYLASFTTFYTFYLMERFGLTAQAAQVQLFVLLAAVAVGTVAGGPLGDRLGRKRVIWGSILGVAPFTIALPYADLLGTEVLAVVIGLILASAFSAILVFAQELVPNRVGLVAGLFFGLAFGVAGVAAAALGSLADQVGLPTVFHWCSYLPLLGVSAALLPNMAASHPPQKG